MTKQICVGDIVKSIAGHDKGKFFLVIKTENGFAYVANGKQRKTDCPKKKNNKHLISIYPQAEKELAEQIKDNRPVGKERLYKTINGYSQKF